VLPLSSQGFLRSVAKPKRSFHHSFKFSSLLPQRKPFTWILGLRLYDEDDDIATVRSIWWRLQQDFQESPDAENAPQDALLCYFGRKHSEGEKMHGWKKCGKRVYIEVGLRDHRKLWGEPIECKCEMKFAFKCDLVVHKKSHPKCNDNNYSTTNSDQDCKSSSISSIQKLPHLASNSCQTNSNISSSTVNFSGYAEEARQLKDIGFSCISCAILPNLVCQDIYFINPVLGTTKKVWLASLWIRRWRWLKICTRSLRRPLS